MYYFARVKFAIVPPLATALAILFGASATRAQEVRELLQLGTPPVEAALEAMETEGALQMREGDGSTLSLFSDVLVRWSTPAALRSSDALLLADGGILALAPAWGSRPSFTLDGTTCEARTRRLGRIAVKRSSMTALLLKLPRDEMEVAEAIDRVHSIYGNGEHDQLLLDNGDVVFGKLLRIDVAARGANQLSFEAVFGLVELPIDRVQAVIFANQTQPDEMESSQRNLLVGLDDGSLVPATSLAPDNSEILVRSELLGTLRIEGVEQIAFLQSLARRLTYLSDIEAASYRHEPYLELSWKYCRDRNALGQPLRASDRTYLKGLGMHSISRLTYDLDSSHTWFAAAVAIDDAAEGGGSVAFRVRLAKNGKWREAWSSGVVRGGQQPRHLRIELMGADQLELVVEAANRGDERDYANWLDARLERAE